MEDEAGICWPWEAWLRAGRLSLAGANHCSASLSLSVTEYSPANIRAPSLPRKSRTSFFLFTMKGNALDPRIYGVRILALKEGRGI